MQVTDPAAWSDIEQQLRDTETGTLFLKFLRFWADGAEKDIADGLDTQMCNGLPSNPATPAKALRKVFEVAEQTLGKVSVALLAQMLAVLRLHWVHGEQMAKELTVFEHRLIEEALLVKVAELRDSAALP